MLLVTTTYAGNGSVRVEGRINVGLGYSSKNYYRDDELAIFDEETLPDLSCETDIRVRLDGRLQGEIGLRGDVNEASVRLDEAAIRYRYGDNVRLTCGNLKKTFSSEEQVSGDELVTVERSYYNDFLSSFAVMGRELGVVLDTRTVRLRTEAGLYGNNSDMVTVAFRGETDAGSVVFGGAVMYSIVYSDPDFWLAEWDAAVSGERWACEIEIAGGVNPVETRANRFIGDKETAYFAAVRTLASMRFGKENAMRRTVQPLVSLTTVAPDMGRNGSLRTEAVYGVNWYLHKRCRLQLNNGFLFANTAYRARLRLQETRVMAVWQLMWRERLDG